MQICQNKHQPIKTSARLYPCLRLFLCGHKPWLYRFYYAPTGFAPQKHFYARLLLSRENAATSDMKTSPSPPRRYLELTF
jgi:hypothetical protein